jgi:hypothetical protein
MKIKPFIKDAILDVLKEKVDRENNNGLALNHKANPSSNRLLYYNGIVIDGDGVYQSGRPIFTINYIFSAKQKNKKG